MWSKSLIVPFICLSSSDRTMPSSPDPSSAIAHHCLNLALSPTERCRPLPPGKSSSSGAKNLSIQLSDIKLWKSTMEQGQAGELQVMQRG